MDAIIGMQSPSRTPSPFPLVPSTSQFIFWQQQYKSIAGGEYLNVYPTMDLPVTDIIDPLTGALLERIPGYLSPDDMLERLTRFLDSHTWGKMGGGEWRAMDACDVTARCAKFARLQADFSGVSRACDCDCDCDCACSCATIVGCRGTT